MPRLPEYEFVSDEFWRLDRDGVTIAMNAQGPALAPWRRFVIHCTWGEELDIDVHEDIMFKEAAARRLAEHILAEDYNPGAMILRVQGPMLGYY